eukprot:scaffold1052_cov339-Pavlova_lutheri.AAC.27
MEASFGVLSAPEGGQLRSSSHSRVLGIRTGRTRARLAHFAVEHPARRDLEPARRHGSMVGAKTNPASLPGQAQGNRRHRVAGGDDRRVWTGQAHT